MFQQLFHAGMAFYFPKKRRDPVQAPVLQCCSSYGSTQLGRLCASKPYALALSTFACLFLLACWPFDECRDVECNGGV